MSGTQEKTENCFDFLCKILHTPLMKKETLFEATGAFDIDANLKPVCNGLGEICEYELPDGRIVRLVIALEIESKGSCTYITSETEMDELGFSDLNYDQLNFFEY